MSDETITSLVLGAAVAVFVWDRLPVAVAVGVTRTGARRVVVLSR